MNIQTIIKDIYKLIAECNQTESIDTLINHNQRLAGYLFYLSKHENEAHKSYLEAYNERKYQTALLTDSGNGTATDRGVKAEIQIKKLRQNECDAKVYHKKLENLKNDTKEFIGVTTQKISILKLEQNITKKEV